LEKVCSARQAHLVRIPDSHTADNIVDELKGVLSDWSLSQQGIAATTDNGANIKSAIGMFDCPHFPCFSHTLQLAVEQALKTSRGCKDDWKTQTTNGHFNYSSKSNYLLCQKQLALHHKQLSLLQDVITRWNSGFYMVECILAQQ